MEACSTTHLFHYFFSDDTSAREAMERDGLRPLSDFPDSERWQQLEAQMPGFYRNLYGMIAEPVLGRPYENSGVFITPIDFRVVLGTYLSDKPRYRIPIDRISGSDAVITYVIDDERSNLPFTSEHLTSVSELWDEAMIRDWFGRDQTKVFFYVPQVATYQGRITVGAGDFESA
jgi:hypothetical protein